MPPGWWTQPWRTDRNRLSRPRVARAKQAEEGLAMTGVARYRAKRHFAKTAEPQGSEALAAALRCNGPWADFRAAARALPA